ncbi:mitochondrial amidoxime-reducing component 1-like [Penaeus chinensis]|uniref:mitochondrial amidoxime-reducing component 1-like n=1 Tax=Penaeus chinensis TaxID=139456 RepID=UPI001FB7A23F|nr:mitochondrial amidoxime-reducing component 1-like [Penaeus chinensis]
MQSPAAMGGRLSWGVGLAVGVGVTTAAGWWAWMALRRRALRWEEVGILDQLVIYPVKSARGIPVASATARRHGLARDHIQDRSFMVVRENGSFVSGRHAGSLITVSVTLEAHDQLILHAQDGSDMQVDLRGVMRKPAIVEARMWGKDVKGIDCGDEVAAWLTRVLFDGETRVRLIYKGDVMEDRPANPPQYFTFPQFQETDRMYYADTCAYLVATASSLQDLNARLQEPVPMSCFRPNLVIQCDTPFDEDDWAFVKIGEVVMRRLKPCERCIQTTINVNTGVRHPTGEPITTLKTYRVPEEPERLAKLWKNKPIFGVNMAIESTGELHTGDIVYVARKSAHSWFRST